MQELISSEKELYQELQGVLDRLVKVYRLLLDCVRREKELLIEVNINELEENNRAKEASLKKLRKLEAERIRIVRLIAQQKNLKHEPLRLLDLAESYAGSVESEELRQKHAVLDLLVKRVIENNRQNEELAQSALKNVTGALNTIRDNVQEKPVYERKGGMKNQGQSGHLVKREV